MEKEQLENARAFCLEVKALAEIRNLPFFVVTEGASATSNNGCDAVKNARENHIKLELENGHNPYEEWEKDR